MTLLTPGEIRGDSTARKSSCFSLSCRSLANGTITVDLYDTTEDEILISDEIIRRGYAKRAEDLSSLVRHQSDDSGMSEGGQSGEMKMVPGWPAGFYTGRNWPPVMGMGWNRPLTVGYQRPQGMGYQVPMGMRCQVPQGLSYETSGMCHLVPVGTGLQNRGLWWVSGGSRCYGMSMGFMHQISMGMMHRLHVGLGIQCLGQWSRQPVGSYPLALPTGTGYGLQVTASH